MGTHPVIKNFSYCLAQVPDLVRYGSKPRRDIARDQGLEEKISRSLRSYPEAVCYPPNQTFVGNLTPEELAKIPRPWFQSRGGPGGGEPEGIGRFGEIADQELFLALLNVADVLKPPLFQPDELYRVRLEQRLASHPLFGADTSPSPPPPQPAHSPLSTPHPTSLPIYHRQERYGWFHRDQRAEGVDDENLAAHHLLENLSTKASAALALKWLLHREDISANQVDFVISCGEEACGDRYQRGGGGMAKAIGQMCGCNQASGLDIKNFCAAPASALILAGAMVQSGLHERIVVVGGGSLAKLGMKFQAFLAEQMPILDDCLASLAFLVTADDGLSPIIRLEPGAVGKVPIGASGSEESVYRSYLLEPLSRLGLDFTDIDKFAPELQNPEIMERSGSGDVAKKNYRKIAAMAVLSQALEKKEMNSWIQTIGMPGFAPTQGHIPSAVPYLGHATEAIRGERIQRAMFLAKASIFLNRCTDLFDGVSFIIERNPQLGPLEKQSNRQL
ncbi:glycine/sarcosine/betaine reductase complex component C subunit beta [Desulfogranum mediterraneum]|uniref:glycine/sarcosine/betaine reductase complex component C subunit beta n=1 Tax=Desulfogranum mediterraneum TaxID=160661 RepID=UPI00054F70A4|nr:glycine/sarcosine/betaine reductase complex component C subunit beta [Desulfogranum mediterraneum]